MRIRGPAVTPKSPGRSVKAHWAPPPSPSRAVWPLPGQCDPQRESLLGRGHWELRPDSECPQRAELREPTRRAGASTARRGTGLHRSDGCFEMLGNQRVSSER